MEEENQKIEKIEPDVPIIYQEDVVAVAEMAEKRIAAASKIKMIALKVTNSNDWVNENNRPYLQSSGGEKVARVFGISISNVKQEKSDLKEGHYMWTTSAKFSMKGSSIEVIGTRSSNDDLYSKRKKYYDDKGNKLAKPESYTLPAIDVDEANIKKASYTNCTANGISRFLGLRNFTWEELAEYKIYPGENEVNYKGGKGKTAEGSKESDTREKAHAMMVEMYGDDYRDKLSELSSFPGKDKKTGEEITIPGKKSLPELSPKWFQSTYGKIQEQYKKFKPKDPPTMNNQVDGDGGRGKFLKDINTQHMRVGSKKFIATTKDFKGKSYPDDYTDDDLENLYSKLCKLSIK